MFEHEGDRPGERQLWEQSLKLDQRLPFPAGRSDIYTNDEGGVADFDAFGGDSMCIWEHLCSVIIE